MCVYIYLYVYLYRIYICMLYVHKYTQDMHIYMFKYICLTIHTHTYVSISMYALITALSEQLHITWDLAKRVTWQHPRFLASPLSVCWKEKSLHYRRGGPKRKESNDFYVRPWPQPGGTLTAISRENNLLPTPRSCSFMYVKTSQQE